MVVALKLELEGLQNLDLLRPIWGSDSVGLQRCCVSVLIDRKWCHAAEMGATL